jgi:hypothetical protein
MNKLLAILDLFRKGNAVADPALWKSRQIKATVLLPAFGALVAVLRAFGLEVPLDDTQITQLVTGLVVVINLLLTYSTTDKVGLPAKPDRDPPGRFPDIKDPETGESIFGGRG